MSFWDDFAEGMKDVATSTTRIVTDTAIDLGNVATGFQFNDEMEAAKKEMSDAGMLSAADAIEKNHYGFLKSMEQEANRKFDLTTSLYQEGKQVELSRNVMSEKLDDMLDQVIFLAQMSKDAQTLLDEARNIPDWDKWSTILAFPQQNLHTLKIMHTAQSKWNDVSQRIILSRMSADTSSGILAGISAVAAASKATATLKAAKLASTSSKVTKASKFIKFGKLAGKASAVLSIVSIGLDVGLSVSQLETKKDALEKTLADLNSDIADANQDITLLHKEIREIQQRIYELLHSITPVQTESSWDNWVVSTKAELNATRNALISLKNIREKAIKMALLTQGEAYDYRVKLIASVDVDITEEEAKIILAELEQNPTNATLGRISTNSNINASLWHADGPGKKAINDTESLNTLHCKYSLNDQAVWHQQTWTYSANAARSQRLTFAWDYNGFHAWHKPKVKISAFADGPEGRRQITLLQGGQRTGHGHNSIQIHAGETFGFIIQGSNYDRDTRLLGDLVIDFNSHQ